MKTKHKKRTGLSMTVAATSLLASAFSSEAAVTSGTASGMALRVDLTLDQLLLLPTLTMNVGPLSGTSITTPDPDENDSLLTFSSNVVGLASVSTGLLTSSSTSNVTGFAMNGTANGASTVNDLNLSIGGLLSLSADTITSNSNSSGSYDSLLSTGESLFEGLTLTVGVTSIDLSTYLNAQGKFNPNTSINLSALGIVGLTIIFNEQITSENGSSSTGITTNAVRISVDTDLVGLGGLDGDITIGQSSSGLTAIESPIPEPSTAAALGLVGVGFMLRRRR